MQERRSQMIVLTEQQQKAVRNGEAVRVAAPELGEDVVLLRASQFESIRELVEDQHERRAVLNYAMKQAAKVAQENPY